MDAETRRALDQCAALYKRHGKAVRRAEKDIAALQATRYQLIARMVDIVADIGGHQVVADLLGVTAVYVDNQVYAADGILSGMAIPYETRQQIAES